ncbi:hypothetical protein NW761_013770 [Fusarium oxysporum]|nr:hypothetical protein NW758_013507 [Fusarium oxysporum]KAJ4074554.1 hypothetical protein NW761_013770 [Fusarium oxysporum]
MYLDDGVSKDSAPNNLPQYKYQDPAKSKKAKGFYREVKMTQESTSTARTLTICHPWNGFDAKSTVGDIYNFAVWTVKTGGAAPQVQVSFQDENGKTVDDARLSHNYDSNRGVLTVSVPVELVPSLDHPATTNDTLTNASTNGASVNGHSKDRHIAVKITGLT